MELTPSQQRAVDALDRHCIVVAGPGAGKTLVLVERALQALKRHAADLDQIVAITFTNRAANQMRERMRKEMARLAQAAKRQEARRWIDLRRRLEYAQINTIHGLCASILRAQPVEARVDPSFAILDEYESRLLLLEAAEETVNELLESHDETIAQLVTAYKRHQLIDALVSLYEAARTLGLTIDDVRRLTEGNLTSTQGYLKAFKALDEAARALISFPQLTSRMREQVDDFAASWRAHGATLAHAASAAANDSPLDAAQAFDKAVKRIKEALPTHRGGRGGVSDLIRELKGRLEEIELAFYDCVLGKALDAIIRALKSVEQRYMALKEARRSLDYEDLQWKVRDLFRAYPELARRYRDKFRFVLVDEFQDTNRLQKEIISMIAFGEGRGSNLFIVGDPAQSVYNFRGAEVEVFEETAAELDARGAERIPLGENFRSTAELIKFFNAFFAKVMEPAIDQDHQLARRLGFVPYLQGVASRRVPGLGVPVELLLEIGEHVGTADEARELEAERIAERIRGMVTRGEKLVGEIRRIEHTEQEYARPVRYSDIALLFRAMTDVNVYERALRRAGIPYYVLSGKGFYERQEIQDVLSLLKFLENRTDEIALVAALRSPLFGISDETLYWLRQHAGSGGWAEGPHVDHHPLLTSLLSGDEIGEIKGQQRDLLKQAAETIARLLELRNRMSLEDLLREILLLTNYAAIQSTRYDGYQRVANLTKLQELARSFEATGPHFLRDFIRFVEQFTEMESREAEAQLEAGLQDAVQIMTIHKAKGLEFPVVFIPDLARRLQPHIPDLAFDRSLGIGMKAPDRRGRLHETASRREVAARIKARDFYENQRLLFVACTRARDYLVLAGAAKEVKCDRPPHEANSYLEWIFSVLGLEGASAAADGSLRQGVGALEDLIEWKGVKIKVSLRAGKLTAASEQAEHISVSNQTVVEKHPEIKLGQPCALPEAVDEATEREMERIVRRIGPISALDEGPTKLAVTRLLAFARCPLQYYYEVALGLPESDQYDEDRHEDSLVGELSAVERGRIVHRFCELYDATEPPERVLNLALEKEGLLGAETQQRARRQLWPLIERYLHGAVFSKIKQVLREPGRGRVESEAEFVYRIGGALLRGRIDKLIVENDAATIVDFKTDRVSADKVREMAREYELQMRIYQLAARRVMGFREARAQLYFLQPDVLVDLGDEVSDPEAERLISDLCQALMRARATGDYPANPAPDRCRRCPCFSFCPARSDPS